MVPTLRSSPPTQHEILAALSDPASYPYRPNRIEIVQTHISIVAIAPPHVYKIKKPVDFGFLDYSTLERRRHFCEEEVRLNRRLCAQIYEGVVPLVRCGDRLVVEGEGTPVEFAVKMRYLDPAGFFDERLARGTFSLTDFDRVLTKLAAFYREQTPSPDAAVWGRTERLRLSTDENFAQTEPFAGDLLSRPAFDALRAATDRFYHASARLLNRRRAEGRIVDGHGDLRLEHLHLDPASGPDAEACIFDCIEFSERLRFVDVASDVAFLAMDLDVHGRPDLARYAAEYVSECLGDPDLLDVLDFYKGYRAHVRGKVEAMRSTEAEVPAPERAASRARAREYFQLALGIAVAGSAPLVVIVMGGIGTGKSTQARTLGEALGWPVFSSDRMRKEAAGVPLFERGSAAERAALYAPARTEATYAALHDAALRRARDGQSTILDATFGTRRQRDALREALSAAGVAYRFVELAAPEPVVQRRLRLRDAAPGVSDAREDDFAMLSARFEAPDALEDAEHIVVESGAAAESTTREILLHLVRLCR